MTIKIFAINWDREILYQRINKRVDIMIEQGLIEEVKKYSKKNITNFLQRMQGLGYKEVVDYINGIYTKEENDRKNKNGNKKNMQKGN